MIHSAVTFYIPISFYFVQYMTWAGKQVIQDKIELHRLYVSI